MVVLGAIFLLPTPKTFISADTPVSADLKASHFPKLANYFLKWELTDAEARDLSRYDVLVLDMEVQQTSLDQLKKIKQYNPSIKILAYVTSQEIMTNAKYIPGFYLRNNLFNGIDESWYLKKANGEKISSWPGTYLLNSTDLARQVNGKTWNTYLPEFMHNRVMSTGLWDGIYYDNIWHEINWVAPDQVDINNDYQKDGQAYVDQKWADGVKKLLSYSRQLEADDKIIMVNGDIVDSYKPYVNGRMLESFPTPWGSDGSWEYSMQNYQLSDGPIYPTMITILNGNTDNTGIMDYKKMRFALVSSMIFDHGYFSFDHGTSDHSQLWRFDEYKFDLGKPMGAAYTYLYNNPQASELMQKSVWRRDFENGTVLLNSTTQQQAITLEKTYHKINGSQDPTVNNNQLVNNIVLQPDDAIILLKPKSIIVHPVNKYIKERVFNVDGGYISEIKNSAYDANNFNVDLNRDGVKENIRTQANKIIIKNYEINQTIEFYPFGKKNKANLSIAAGDLEGDGKIEIIAAPQSGIAEVRVFNEQGRQLLPGFYPFGTKKRQGATIAVGDINYDGSAEILATPYGFSNIKIFNKQGNTIKSGFNAFSNNWLPVKIEISN